MSGAGADVFQSFDADETGAANERPSPASAGAPHSPTDALWRAVADAAATLTDAMDAESAALSAGDLSPLAASRLKKMRLTQRLERAIADLPPGAPSADKSADEAESAPPPASQALDESEEAPPAPISLARANLKTLDAAMKVNMRRISAMRDASAAIRDRLLRQMQRNLSDGVYRRNGRLGDSAAAAYKFQAKI